MQFSADAWSVKRGEYQGVRRTGGSSVPQEISAAILTAPLRAWTLAWDDYREPRDSAWLAEITGMLDLACWPKRPPEVGFA
jgi:hypothetical protein